MTSSDTTTAARRTRRIVAAILVPGAIALGLWFVLQDRDRQPERVDSRDIVESADSTENRESASPNPSTAKKSPGAIASVEESEPTLRTADDTVPIAAPPPPSIDDDMPGTLVYGRITHVGPSPRDEYRGGVSFHDAFGERVIARTDENQRYSLAGLAPGTWWASAGRSGFESETHRIDLGDEPIVRVDFELEAEPRIVVKVIPEGGGTLRDFIAAAPGHAGLVPVATLEPPGEYFTEIIGSANNTYGVGHFIGNGYIFDTLPGEYLGYVFLDEAPPLYLSLVHYHDVLQTIRVEPGDDVVTFTAPIERARDSHASFMARFVDAQTGEPVEGVQASLSSSGSGAGGRLTSEADGIVRVANLAPGEYAWTATSDGYARIAERVLVRRGDVTNLGDVRLAPECVLSGRVLNEDGDPVVTDIHATPLDAGNLGIRDRNRIGSARSNVDGNFQIAALKPGVYAVTVSNRSSGNDDPLVSEIVRVQVDLDTSPVDDLELRATPATSIILRGGATPMASLRDEILDPQDIVRTSRGFYGEAPVKIPVPQGVHRIRILDRTSDALILEETLVVGADPVPLTLP